MNNCKNCGNETHLISENCHQCLSEIGKYKLCDMSAIRCRYELNVIKGLPYGDMKRDYVQKHIEGINNRLEDIVQNYKATDL